MMRENRTAIEKGMKRMSRILLCAFCALVLGGCTPTATNESKQAADGKGWECKQSLNRGWLTEQEIKGYAATCNPKTGKVTLKVDEQSQSTQTEALAAVAEGAARGARPGP